MTEPKAVHTRWADVPLEKMRGGMDRRYVHSDKMMVAHVEEARLAFTALGKHRDKSSKDALFAALDFPASVWTAKAPTIIAVAAQKMNW